MSKSWSSLKKELEQNFLCDALKGTVKYFYTVYRESHDGIESRFAVLVNDEEVFRANSFNRHCKYWPLEKELKETLNISWQEASSFVKDVAQKNFDYCSYDVLRSIHLFFQDPIESSIDSDDAIIKMFAIIDRRVGKRTLKKIKDEIELQPKWLQYFYGLRMDAERI